MLPLIFTALVGVIIFTAFIIIIHNKPDFWFWLFLNLYFDPGGYIRGYLGGALIGPLNMSDIFIVGIVICLISARVNWNLIGKDKLFVNFLSMLIIFGVYHFVIFGGIVPYYKDDLNYFSFLIKNRIYIYGIIIFVSVYAFALRNLNYYYTITLSVGIICLTAYWITLTTGINLIPVVELKRYSGKVDTGMTRLGIYSFGIFYQLFLLALICFLLTQKEKIKLYYKTWLYYGGILMVMTALVSLTRRLQIDILASVLLVIILIVYLYGLEKLFKPLKLVLPIILIVIAMLFTLPEYTDHIVKTGEDTFSILFTGEDAGGVEEYRVKGTGDLEIVKNLIGDNLFFGNGFSHIDWGNENGITSTRGDKFAVAWDAAEEVPIYFSLFAYGIAGVILIALLYVFLIKLSFNLLKKIKMHYAINLKEPLILLFSIYFLSSVAKMFTSNLYQLGSAFFATNLSSTAVLIGIGFALYSKIFFDLVQGIQNNIRYSFK
ncbi:MAG: hypothetical protein KGZ85_08800 [Ignavibacterium sp.]|nr:hypothetical protein [Ignavibacterium sp.]